MEPQRERRLQAVRPVEFGVKEQIPLKPPAWLTEKSGVSTPQRKSLASYVPTARLAQLLVVARGKSGLSLEEMSERVFQGRFTVFQLMQLEAAILPISDDDLRAIAKAYALDYTIFAPARGLLRVDLAGLTISIGNVESTFAAGSSSADVLTRYLALLYNLRLTKPGDPLVLRDPDIIVLAKAYACPPNQVEQSLNHILKNNVQEIRAQLKALTKRPSFLERLRG